MGPPFNHTTTPQQNSTAGNKGQLNLLEFQIVFLIITIVATVLGNVLVLAAIYVDTRLRNVTNYFVACLAVSDLLVACFSVTIHLHQYLLKTTLNIHVCRFWLWMDTFCEAASIFALTVISVDRYFKISQPFNYREKVTKTIGIAVIVTIWVSAGLFATLGVFPYSDTTGVTVVDVCRNTNKIFYTIAAIVAFFFPLAILVIMYTLIFRIALYHFNKSNAITLVDPTTGKKIHYSAHKDLKATRTLFIVVSTFVICWGPFFTLFLIQLYNPTVITGDSGTLISVLFFIILPSANSFFNPIIYACFDKVYRRTFRKILFKLIGRLDYLASTTEYTSQPQRQTSRSVFELTASAQAAPPSSTNDQMNDGCQQNGLTAAGSKETDTMLQPPHDERKFRISSI